MSESKQSTKQAAQKNIYQRIQAVMEAVPYIQKDATVQTKNNNSYKGVTHDAVIAKLRGPMIQNGIVLSISQINDHVVEGQTKGGMPKIRYEAWYEISLINADSPEDRVAYKVQAHAEDGGDKAPGKSLSYAVKSILLKAFALETGESDESRFQPDEIAYITEEQAADLRQWIEDTDSDETAFCQWLKVDSIESIPAGHYKRAQKALEQKLRKLQEPST